MNLLDENIAASQRVLLRNARIPFRQIGYEEARKGIQDDEIISFLVQSRRVTFFTRDDNFYQSRFRHAHYCIVLLDVAGSQAAENYPQVSPASRLPNAGAAYGNRCSREPR